MPNNYLILLATLSCYSLCATYIFTGTINGNTPVTNFTYSIPISSQVVACIFRMPSTSHRNVIMIARSYEFNQELTRQNVAQLYQNRNSQIAYMDLMGAINGDGQLVNVNFNRGANNTIYLSFYNLDLPAVIIDKPYQLYFQTIDYYGIVCFSCPFGMYLNSQCYCQTCSPNYYGKRCNYFIKTMQQDTKYTSVLNTITNVYFRIQDPPQVIDLFYYQQQLTHNVHLYVQFQQIPGDLAGYLNSYHDYMNKSYEKLVSIQENNFTINTGGKNIMITISSKNTGHSAHVILRYQNPNKSKLPLILGLTFGFIGFIVTIIIIACCCRRCKQRRLVLQNSFYLSRKQIDLYYPQVDGQLVLSYLKNLQQSYSKIKTFPQQQQNSQGYECVICLNEIDSNTKVRVTFCKHVFHGHCLLRWFQKNQNCPFCRNPCNRQPSQQQYAQIKKNRRKPTPRQLVTAILNLTSFSNIKQSQQISKQQILIPQDQIQIQQQLKSYNTKSSFKSTVKSTKTMKRNRSPNRRQPKINRNNSIVIQNNQNS